MSKHWRPDETAAPLCPRKARRDWARLHAYWSEADNRRLPQGGTAGLVLVAAACLGIAFAIYQAFSPRDAIAPGAETRQNPVEPSLDR